MGLRRQLLDVKTALSLEGNTYESKSGKTFNRGDESYCMDMPEPIESALIKIRNDVKNDLQNQTATNDWRGGSYVELLKVVKQNHTATLIKIFMPMDIYI